MLWFEARFPCFLRSKKPTAWNFAAVREKKEKKAELATNAAGDGVLVLRRRAAEIAKMEKGWRGATVGAAYRMAALAPWITHLDLSFAGCNIGTDGATAVAAGIETLEKLCELSLNLSFCEIGTEGATAVANGIKKLGGLRELSLNLSGLEELGVLAVVQSLPGELELTSRRAHALAAVPMELEVSRGNIFNLFAVQVLLPNAFRSVWTFSCFVAYCFFARHFCACVRVFWPPKSALCAFSGR